jgi:hypothetical protein
MEIESENITLNKTVLASTMIRYVYLLVVSIPSSPIDSINQINGTNSVV